jgi:hypothetical protein
MVPLRTQARPGMDESTRCALAAQGVSSAGEAADRPPGRSRR